MSMTVRIALEGLDDLSFFKEALDAMKIPFELGEPGVSDADRGALGRAWVDGRPVEVHRSGGGVVFSGDSEWRRFQGRGFQNRLRQQYSLAAVRHRIVEMGYQVGDVETLRNGTVKIVARAWR